MKRALLVVSFGTSVPQARANILTVENTLKEAAPDWSFYRAFTSPRIRASLAKRGETIPSLEEALKKILRDGIRCVTVQPTHILYGLEYDKMKDTVEKYRPAFDRLILGVPLFSSMEDILETAQILSSHYPVEKEKHYVFMGHGTEHFADVVYPALEAVLHRMGRTDCLVATVEGWPDFESVCSGLAKIPVKLVPLMLCAGEHALKDMAGDTPGSLKSMLECRGCQVEWIQEGLGMLPEIRRIYARHLKSLTETEE